MEPDSVEANMEPGAVETDPAELPTVAAATKKRGRPPGKGTPKKGIPKKPKTPKTAEEEKAEAEKKKLAEKMKKFDWGNSAAKKYLHKQFRDGAISTNYSRDDGGPGPRAVWDTHCKGHPAFKGMIYNDTFASRLRLVKQDAIKKKKRAEVDHQNYDNFRKHFPIPSTNIRGEPRWQGSEAERLLKEDIEYILMLDDETEKKKMLEPKVFHKSRPQFLEYSLDVFRDHIYQEQRLRKFLNYIKLDSTKPSKNKVLEK